MLSDPERRRRYDETGDAGEPKDDAAFVAEMVAQAVGDAAGRSDTDRENVVANARRLLAAKRAQAEAEADKAQGIADRAARAAGRVRKGGRPVGEDDPVAAVFREASARAAKAAADMRRTAAVLARVQAALDGYGYEHDPDAGADVLSSLLAAGAFTPWGASGSKWTSDGDE